MRRDSSGPRLGPLLLRANRSGLPQHRGRSRTTSGRQRHRAAALTHRLQKQAAGVWEAAHAALLERLNAAGAIDWSAPVVDGSHIRALQGALTGPSPVDRGRTGSKHHLICDPSGIPLASSLTGGNRRDVTRLLPLVDGVGPARGKTGRPRLRAESLLADRGYDFDKHRRALWAPGVKSIIARRGVEHGGGWEATAGSSSAASPGCTSSAASASAANAGQTSTRPS
jgi:hypothetical protein